MSLRGEALKRAYAKGNRIKIDACHICGQPIYNRMVYADSGNPVVPDYAYFSCSKKQPKRNWERGW